MNGNLVSKFLGVFGDLTIRKPSPSTDLSYKDVMLKNSFQLWGRTVAFLSGPNPCCWAAGTWGQAAPQGLPEGGIRL